MDNIVIGIEGPVGSGKTSICRNLLDKIPSSILVNGGNIYRAIVYAIINTGITLEELEKSSDKINIKEMMDKHNVTIDFENKETILKLGDKKILEEDLQSPLVSMAVSKVSGSAKNKELFLFARELIDNLRHNYNVIVAGRSLNIIYPNLSYHLFITASLEKRVERKCMQYNVALDTEEGLKIKENVVLRDKLQEESGYYKIYDNTIIIDTSDALSVEESTNMVLNKINLN